MKRIEFIKNSNRFDDEVSLTYILRKQQEKFVGAITRKGGQPAINYLKRIINSSVSSLTSSRVTLIARFCFHCHSLYIHNGYTGLVKYLKTSQVLLQQAIGGYVVPDSLELGARVTRSRSGLPYFIPAYQRILIKKGDIPTIRFWMTLYGIYRIIQCKGVLKLSTIIDPGPPIKSRYLNRFRAFVKESFELGLPKIRVRDLKAFPYVISKSSPSSSSAVGDNSTSIFGL